MSGADRESYAGEQLVVVVPDRLRAAREAADLTLVQLAGRVSGPRARVSSQALSRCEQPGRSRPRMRRSVFAACVAALHVEGTWLMGRTPWLPHVLLPTVEGRMWPDPEIEPLPLDVVVIHRFVTRCLKAVLRDLKGVCRDAQEVERLWFPGPVRLTPDRTRLAERPAPGLEMVAVSLFQGLWYPGRLKRLFAIHADEKKLGSLEPTIDPRTWCAAGAAMARAAEHILEPWLRGRWDLDYAALWRHRPLAEFIAVDSIQRDPRTLLKLWEAEQSPLEKPGGPSGRRWPADETARMAYGRHLEGPRSGA